MLRKRAAETPGKILVTFHIPGTIWAETVHLVGDFNDWDRESLPMMLNRDGDWIIEIELDEGESYRFRYLFDSTEWNDEWMADRYEKNEFGTYDSVVVAELNQSED